MCANVLQWAYTESGSHCKVKLVAVLDQAGVLPSLSHKSVGSWSSYLFDSPCSPYWLLTLRHQS